MDPTTWSLGTTVAAKATLLLGAAFAASVALRRASASAHHLLWALTFGALTLLPVLSVLSTFEGGPRIPVALTAAAPANAPETELREPGVSRFEIRRPSPSAGASRPALDAPVSGSLSLAGLWAFGTLILLGRLGLGFMASGRTKRGAVVLTEPEWTEALAAARKRLGVRQAVELRRGGAFQLPFTLGLLHPTVVLPEASRRYSARRRWAVLLHELAHVRRRDCGTQLVSQIGCAAFWWHPLAWMGLRRLRALGERAADDLVIDAGARVPDYAHDLLELARGLHREPLTPLASVTMAHRARFEERLLALLEPGVARASVTSRLATVSALVALLLVLALALTTPTRTAPTLWAASSAQGVETAPRTEADPQREIEPAPAADAEPAVAPASAVQTAPAPESDARARAREALAGALDDPDPSVRKEALHALVRFGDASMAPRLEQTLKDEDADIRAEAAWGLGRLRSESAVPALVGALRDPVDDVRAQAAWALGVVRDPRALEGLSIALHDESGDVREQAVWALGVLRDRASVDALVGALGDELPDVRRQAAWALGVLTDPRAIEGLARALQDEDADVRKEAAWALGLIAGGKGDEVDLDLDVDVDLDIDVDPSPEDDVSPSIPRGPVL